MRKHNRQLLVELIRPPVLLAGFVAKTIYRAMFGWWLDARLQRKANRALWDDVQANFYFLTSQAQMDFSGPTTIHPFDYASVQISWENLLVTITRGRGDTAVSIAPGHVPNDNYELGRLIAALERRHLREGDMVKSLAGAANLLQRHLQQLNVAFSEQEFPRTKQLLW